MFKKLLIVVLLLLFIYPLFSVEEIKMFEELYPFQNIDKSLLNKLNPYQTHVMLNKGTERAFTGEYDNFYDKGTYYCYQCNAPLYYSDSKFDGGCGWPSFDDEIPHSVIRVADADGYRTEIICATCNAHLGHVFLGEGFTDKDTRHCVNSTSLLFKAEEPVAKAIFAGGCFWGVEYMFESLDGVIEATSGYTGGQTNNPTYQQVLRGNTGHYEAVEVLYNPLIISYEELAKYFFEIHDPEQKDGQGPDIGPQYLSAIFYQNRYEYDKAIELMELLQKMGYNVATELRPVAKFWPAENYHQDYYNLRGTLPYCHTYQKRF